MLKAVLILGEETRTPREELDIKIATGRGVRNVYVRRGGLPGIDRL